MPRYVALLVLSVLFFGGCLPSGTPPREEAARSDPEKAAAYVRASKLIERAEAYRDNRQYAAAQATYEKAADVYTDLGDDLRRAQLLDRIGGMHQERGDYTSALLAYDDALALWRKRDNPAAEATTLACIAAVRKAQGEYADAIRFYGRSLRLKHRHRDVTREAYTYLEIADVLRLQQKFDEGHKMAALARSMLDTEKDTLGVIQSFGIASKLYQDQGDWTQALAAAEKAVELSAGADAPYVKTLQDRVAFLRQQIAAREREKREQASP